MCGRYTLAAPPARLQEIFRLAKKPASTPRYNIAPTDAVLALRRKIGEETEAVWLRWGLVPEWAKDAGLSVRTMINARAESVFDKPAFKQSVLYRRCLVPGDGFYEWRRGRGVKQPYWFTLSDGRPFAMAGIWERWRGEGDRVVETCAVLTTAANELVADLHDRMPLILREADHALWMDAGVVTREAIEHLLAPFAANAMTRRAVTTHVNRVGNDSPRCIEPSGQGELF